MSHAILMSHALTGMLFVLAAVWVFVDVLNVNESNVQRIRAVSWGATVIMLVTLFVGGWWYVVNYAKDKAVILKGAWPFAHNFFMETKEHIIFVLVLLAILLPITASNDLVRSPKARKLTLWISGLIAVIAIGMEGAGAIISMGAKVGLLPVTF